MVLITRLLSFLKTTLCNMFNRIFASTRSISTVTVHNCVQYLGSQMQTQVSATAALQGKYSFYIESSAGSGVYLEYPISSNTLPTFASNIVISGTYPGPGCDCYVSSSSSGYPRVRIENLVHFTTVDLYIADPDPANVGPSGYAVLHVNSTDDQIVINYDTVDDSDLLTMDIDCDYGSGRGIVSIAGPASGGTAPSWIHVGPGGFAVFNSFQAAHVTAPTPILYGATARFRGGWTKPNTTWSGPIAHP